MTPPLDLFQMHPLRLQQYDLGQQAYHEQRSIDSHGSTDQREIADFQGGWLQAEQSERSVEYWAGVRDEAVARARGIV